MAFDFYMDFCLIIVSCKGCGGRFEDGDCVLVQSGARYHYIPREVCDGTIIFDCFQRELGVYSEGDRVGVYNRGNVHTMPEGFFEIDCSGKEIRARLIG